MQVPVLAERAVCTTTVLTNAVWQLPALLATAASGWTLAELPESSGPGITPSELQRSIVSTSRSAPPAGNEGAHRHPVAAAPPPPPWLRTRRKPCPATLCCSLEHPDNCCCRVHMQLVFLLLAGLAACAAQAPPASAPATTPALVAPGPAPAESLPAPESLTALQLTAQLIADFTEAYGPGGRLVMGHALCVWPPASIRKLVCPSATLVAELTYPVAGTLYARCKTDEEAAASLHPAACDAGGTSCPAALPLCQAAANPIGRLPASVRSNGRLALMRHYAHLPAALMSPPILLTHLWYPRGQHHLLRLRDIRGGREAA